MPPASSLARIDQSTLDRREHAVRPVRGLRMRCRDDPLPQFRRIGVAGTHRYRRNGVHAPVACGGGSMRGSRILIMCRSPSAMTTCRLPTASASSSTCTSRGLRIRWSSPSRAISIRSSPCCRDQLRCVVSWAAKSGTRFRDRDFTAWDPGCAATSPPWAASSAVRPTLESPTSIHSPRIRPCPSRPMPIVVTTSRSNGIK